MLIVNEIFKSLQGESSCAGLPCTFIRLTGCNLRCDYCDTTYAYEEGGEMSVDQVVAEVERLGCRLVELTGGEPLLQGDVYELLRRLVSAEYQVLLETNGSINLGKVPGGVVKIVDFKAPGSGEEDKNLWRNLDYMNGMDEAKFVLSNRDDYLWAKGKVDEHRLSDRMEVLFSPIVATLNPTDLAQWILDDGLRVRLQLQLHKALWGDERGR
ncbi:MAG: radical SAM protein [Nitrospirota bacterium]|nr:radical SAM protein [Nitrospirota bacterium]